MLTLGAFKSLPGVPAFAARLVETEAGCWLLDGKHRVARTSVRIDGADCCAHRLLWAFLHGPLPAGADLFRNCPIVSCCNPQHRSRAPQHPSQQRRGRAVCPRHGVEKKRHVGSPGFWCALCNRDRNRAKRLRDGEDGRLRRNLRQREAEARRKAVATSGRLAAQERARRKLALATPPLCKRGEHPMTAENTARDGRCKACKNARRRELDAAASASRHARIVVGSPGPNPPSLAAKGVDAAALVAAVAARYDVDPDAVYARGRNSLVATARRMAIWVLRERGAGVSEIMRHVGRDHSTVCHNLRRAAEEASAEDRAMVRPIMHGDIGPLVRRACPASSRRAVSAYVLGTLLGRERVDRMEAYSGLLALRDDTLRAKVARALDLCGLGEHATRIELHLAQLGRRAS